MSRICPCRICTTCRYIGVVVVVMNNTARYFKVTSKDVTSEFDGKLNGHTRMRSDFNDNSLTWEVLVHVHRVIVRFSPVAL